MVHYTRNVFFYSLLFSTIFSLRCMEKQLEDTHEFNLHDVHIKSDDDSSNSTLKEEIKETKRSNKKTDKKKSKKEKEKKSFFGMLFSYMNFNFSADVSDKKKNIKVEEPKILRLVKYKELVPCQNSCLEISPENVKEKKLKKVYKFAEQKTFFSNIYTLKDTNKIITLDLKQIKAIDEKNNIIQCNVAQQSGATCAYHALKNGLYMAMLPFVAGYNTILRDNILYALTSAAEINRLIGYEGHWRKKAQEYIKTAERELDADGEWLDKEAIEEALMKFESEHKNILFASSITAKNITIIDNVDNRSTIMYDEDFLKLCQTMRDPNSSCVHIFIVGSMKQNSNYNGLGMGHWYTLVVNKVGENCQFFVSDSLGSSRIDDTCIKKIIEYIQKEGDRSAMTQRLYLNDTVERLLACIRAYITDEYNNNEEYSRNQRARRILECKEILNKLIEKHIEDLSQEYINELKECILLGEKIILVDNNTLLENLPTYIPTITKIRSSMNKSLYLQTTESDDFEVPFKMWLIAYYSVSEKEELEKEVQILVEEIKIKIKKTSQKRKEYGDQFLKLIGNKPSNKEKFVEYKKDLLTLVGLYVNM